MAEDKIGVVYFFSGTTTLQEFCCLFFQRHLFFSAIPFFKTNEKEQPFFL